MNIQQILKLKALVEDPNVLIYVDEEMPPFEKGEPSQTLELRVVEVERDQYDNKWISILEGGLGTYLENVNVDEFKVYQRIQEWEHI